MLLVWRNWGGGTAMDVSAVNKIHSADFRPKADKIGLLVAQKTLESARQNQETGGTVRTGAAKRHAHPYLGHNVDIYV
jgi:hypothetical protein